ncbi:hypothetical protein [Acinetobacter sp. NCu2D-2]|uniref:hypothetical protein n=1 Tax=Acinetobacter sp. NCu2D-2 TaxID=1608473 RepID=UPI000A92C2AA|nr:hypothetical protein [Acinetobacter sp. NCu2D-2]
MPNTAPLFSGRYLPLSWMIGMGFIAIVMTLLQFKQAEFTDLFSLKDWFYVLSTQPIHGWLMTAFVFLVIVFVACTKIIVRHDSITIEAFSILFSTLAERQKIEKLQLYSHAKSQSWAFKSLFPNKAITLEEEWKKSVLGFVLKPAYRSTHQLNHLELRQLSTADRLQLIQVLQQYWDLNPRLILGIDKLSQLKRKYKLR